MGNDSTTLNKSKRAKDDEYYTLYEDIAAELPEYREQLRGKRIICPCDWDESYNEESVYYDESTATQTELFPPAGSVKNIDIAATRAHFEKSFDRIKCNFIKFLVSHAEDYGIASVSVSGYNPATGNGVRFQNIDYSKYDLVITNPPFSQFREFIDVMMANDKKFLVIGPQNAITYKNVFQYIKTNRMWMGYHYHLSGFMMPDGTIIPKNDNLPRSCCWYTNLDVSYRCYKMILTEEYSPDKYPQYDDYEAIEVGKTKLIPYDYAGVMGVPITFLQKYNPQQFEIVGLDRYVEDNPHYGHRFTINGKETFARILIRNLNPQKTETL